MNSDSLTLFSKAKVIKMNSDNLLREVIKVIREFNKKGIIPNAFQIAKEIAKKYEIDKDQELPEGIQSPQINRILTYLEFIGAIKRIPFTGYQSNL